MQQIFFLKIAIASDIFYLFLHIDNEYAIPIPIIFLLFIPKTESAPRFAFYNIVRMRNQLFQVLSDIESEALEETKNKTLSEINENLLNLRFRNFTNINGEGLNVYVGSRGKEKRILPFLYNVSFC